MIMIDETIKKYKLSEICEIQWWFWFEEKLFKKEWLPILKITNIQNDIISEEKLNYFDINDYKWKNLEQYQVKKWDVVMALSWATVWKMWINTTDKIFYLNQRVLKFIPNENIILNKFLYYSLKNQIQEIINLASNSSQQNLSNTSIKKIILTVPSLETQQKIVNILDKMNTYCNDVNDWLLKEYNLLDKQFKFYLNKLLSSNWWERERETNELLNNW